MLFCASMVNVGISCNLLSGWLPWSALSSLSLEAQDNCAKVLQPVGDGNAMKRGGRTGWFTFYRRIRPSLSARQARARWFCDRLFPLGADAALTFHPHGHHHIEDAAFVPAAQPAHAPALDVVTPFNWLAQAKEFRLDWHGQSFTDIHASRRRNWSSRWQRPLIYGVEGGALQCRGLLAAVEHLPFCREAILKQRTTTANVHRPGTAWGPESESYR